jgi:hypothetical protein
LLLSGRWKTKTIEGTRYSPGFPALLLRLRLTYVGYSRHFRVAHGANEFAQGAAHINGIESFWSVAKRRLQKLNGISSHTFYLHLKECEWRFNNRSKNLYAELLKLLRNHPL